MTSLVTGDQQSVVEMTVKDLYLFPVRLLFVDELKVTRCGLIDVVRRTVLKDHVQRDVIKTVHGSIQFGVACANGKVNDARMIIEILFCMRQQLINLRLAVVLQVKKT